MNEPIIYLDANATTPPDPAVWETVRSVASDCYANPGSTHQLGRKARKSLEESRAISARVLGAQPKEVIFTSGGTESTNLALMGLAATVPPERRTIAITGGEHPATAECADRLVKQGWMKILIPLDANGLIITEQLDQLPWEEIGLAAVIYANNETGVIQNVSQVRRLCEQHQTPWHLDVVQAVGRIPVSFHELGATAASFGVHKAHGPRGIGGLLLKDEVPFVPTAVGGFQEASRRPGTEAVALAAGMSTMLSEWEQQSDSIYKNLQELRDRFERQLEQQISPLMINGRNASRLPNTSNMAFPELEAEAILIGLDLAGICCSLGSACASGSAEPSPVLLAMGVEPQLARSALRFSLHKYLKEAEIDEAVRRIVEVVSRLKDL
ncbi:cysteine desulfurase family protein [Rubinisphaera italica]|uniref:Cysteine desulfurase n=1 Tax=Rubinisphaera italica TaxID=2527969 RepID=A0A5C5XKT9_9PLAN|nr:cysteine desulfurase family protein [Rubinisphaera italica]TWT63836.1 Cysteine desulfurase [Rubinisphaera italica]